MKNDYNNIANNNSNFARLNSLLIAIVKLANKRTIRGGKMSEAERETEKKDIKKILRVFDAGFATGRKFERKKREAGEGK